MGRRVAESGTASDKVEAERIARYRLRSLFYIVVWPFKTDPTTTGSSTDTAVDGSPYSLQRAATVADYGAEKARLERTGAPVERVFDAMCEWACERFDPDRVERVRDLRPPDSWPGIEPRSRRPED